MAEGKQDTIINSPTSAIASRPHAFPENSSWRTVEGVKDSPFDRPSGVYQVEQKKSEPHVPVEWARSRTQMLVNLYDINKQNRELWTKRKEGSLSEKETKDLERNKEYSGLIYEALDEMGWNKITVVVLLDELAREDDAKEIKISEVIASRLGAEKEQPLQVVNDDLLTLNIFEMGHRKGKFTKDQVDAEKKRVVESVIPAWHEAKYFDNNENPGVGQRIIDSLAKHGIVQKQSPSAA